MDCFVANASRNDSEQPFHSGSSSREVSGWALAGTTAIFKGMEDDLAALCIGRR